MIFFVRLVMVFVVAACAPVAGAAMTHELILPRADAPMCGAETHQAVVLRATEALVGHALTGTRREALSHVLGAGASRMVISCTEQARSPRLDGGATVTVRTEINIAQLYARLFGLGALHNHAEPLPYTLDIPADEAEVAASTLARLEVAGGMVQRANAAMRLHITREGGGWKATLTGPAGSFRAASPALEHLWSAVWAPYFTRQLDTAPAQVMSLRTWGWRDAAHIRQLENRFKLWNTAVRTARLGEVNLASGKAEAQWSLDVVNAADLANRLAGFAGRWGMQYELQ